METYELKVSELPEKEKLYEEVRTLHMQLLDAEESDDPNQKRRANIDADRYLMEHKDILLPLLVDALAQQIRGVRDAYSKQLAMYDALRHDVAAARITAAEDTYTSHMSEQQAPKPLLARLFKRFDKTPSMQYATHDNKITADKYFTVKLKDGRYGQVVFKHDNGLLEIQGPMGLFTALEDELLISLAPPTKATRTIK